MSRVRSVHASGSLLVFYLLRKALQDVGDRNVRVGKGIVFKETWYDVFFKEVVTTV